MRKKFVSILTLVMMLLISMPLNGFADNLNRGKIIFISMNRMNLENMLLIPSIKKELDTKGYIGLMNIKGVGGNDDKRSYASIGASVKSNLVNNDLVNFVEADNQIKQTYETATGTSSKKIVNTNINNLIQSNLKDNEYGSTYGLLGQTLEENNKKISILGNADIPSSKNPILNRNIGLIAMDKMGRIDSGNIENINKKDSSMPYGIKTDYGKLASETKKYYSESDALFVELGDTYRLDQYRTYLNETTEKNIQNTIYNNISGYLKEVFSMINKNDTVYIVSPFVSDKDYKSQNRLAPVIKIKGDNKGVIISDTTKRTGVVSNIDLGTDILNEFGLQNQNMIGKKYKLIDKKENISYIKDENKKIMASFNSRIVVGSVVGGLLSIPLILGIIAIFLKSKIKYNELFAKISKEGMKVGITIPLALILTPLFNFKTIPLITFGVCANMALIYIIIQLLFKTDLKYMTVVSLLTIAVVIVDCVTGTNLMKNCIMSYDPIYGARYYGMGNEYQGIIIGASVFSMGALLNSKKIHKYVAVVLLIAILLITSNPMMGANVGAAISESIAYAMFILIVFDVKIDLKRSILVGLFAAIVVAGFAFMDIKSGGQSHLGSFVKQIFSDGQEAIIRTFTRKIAMNIGIVKSNMAINIVLIAILGVGIFILRPSKYILNVSTKYPVIKKAIIANIIGCAITLLVNDSGVVSAATASIYIFIPIAVYILNNYAINLNKKQN